MSSMAEILWQKLSTIQKLNLNIINMRNHIRTYVVYVCKTLCVLYINTLDARTALCNAIKYTFIKIYLRTNSIVINFTIG